MGNSGIHASRRTVSFLLLLASALPIVGLGGCSSGSSWAAAANDPDSRVCRECNGEKVFTRTSREEASSVYVNGQLTQFPARTSTSKEDCPLCGGTGSMRADTPENWRQTSPGPAAAELTADDYCNRGTHRSGRYRYREAIEEFDRAIRLDPQCSRAYRGRAEARARTEDLQGALADLDRLLQLQPRDSFAFGNRAHLKEKLGDLEGALADWGHSLQIFPNNSTSLGYRSDLKRKMGDRAGAMADCNKAIEVDRLLEKRAPVDMKEHYRRRGDLNRDAGDLAGAIADYDRAIQLGTHYPSYLGRGLAKWASGDRAGATEDWKVVREFTSGPDLEHAEAEIRKAQGK